MLLRRITQHVKDQNWFAVFLDFLIVVFGVFMGFQVQAWNEHRNDLADTQDYLQRLVTDMELSVERNNRLVNRSQEQVAKLDLVISALEACELPAEREQDFISGLYHLGKYDMPVMLMGTINELNSTGKFTLIRNPDLRDLISESVREQEILLQLDKQILGRLIPGVNYVQSQVRFNFPEHIMKSVSFLDPKLVSFDFPELCADKKFINAIATVRDMRLAAKTFSEQTRDRQLTMIEVLQKNLGNTLQSQGEGW